MKSASGEGGYERLSEQAAALPYAIFARPLPSATDPIATQEAVNAAPDFRRIGVHKGARAAQFAPERAVTVPVTPPCPKYLRCLSKAYILYRYPSRFQCDCDCDAVRSSARRLAG